MNIQVEISTTRYEIDAAHPIDLSIPLRFNGEQPNTYDVPLASARAYEAGSLVGDTRRGGSCNFEAYRLIPHCNGTHTECVGHLALERISLHEVLRSSFMPATLISVAPEPAETCQETCRPEAKAGDQMLTKARLECQLAKHSKHFLQGLLVRTLPNDPCKRSRRYAEPPPPYFTTEAMQLVCALNVQHLLVDIPSVDRTLDEGKMTTHHIFWDLPEESHDANPRSHSMKTITEMIFVPDQVGDGQYILNLQIPAFVADAAPSRPMLYKLRSR